MSLSTYFQGEIMLHDEPDIIVYENCVAKKSIGDVLKGSHFEFLYLHIFEDKIELYNDLKCVATIIYESTFTVKGQSDKYHEELARENLTELNYRDAIVNFTIASELGENPTFRNRAIVNAAKCHIQLLQYQDAFDIYNKVLTTYGCLEDVDALIMQSILCATASNSGKDLKQLIETYKSKFSDYSKDTNYDVVVDAILEKDVNKFHDCMEWLVTFDNNILTTALAVKKLIS